MVRRFRHDQEAEAKTWLVDHNLNDYPLVDAFAEVNGVPTKIYPTSVSYLDENTCVLVFSQPYSGVALV